MSARIGFLQCLLGECHPLQTDIFFFLFPLWDFFCLVNSFYPQDMIPGVAKVKILAPDRTAGTHTMSHTCPYPRVSEFS